MITRLLLGLTIAALQALSATIASSNPIHDKLAVSSENEQNEKLSYAVQDERCRVTRSFFQGFDKSGNAFWNVACANRKTLVIMIKNDAQGQPRFSNVA